MTRKLIYLLASVFLFLHGCSFFPGPQQDSSDPLQVTPARDLDTSIELTAVDVNHIGFKIHIEGWREDPAWVSPLASGRCGTMRFPIGSEDHSQLITLTIEELELSTDFIPAGVDLDSAQAELSKQGIEIEIVTISEANGAGSSWNILQKPDDMDYAEAIRRIRSAMGFYVRGPWVFSIRMDP